ncbi:hypothetical protein ACB092_04G106800 [Castanea dentata]
MEYQEDTELDVQCICRYLKKIGFFLLSSTSTKQYLYKKLTKLNRNHYVSCSTIFFFFFFCLFLSFSLSLRSFGDEKLPCCEINNVRHKLARRLLCRPSTMRSCWDVDQQRTELHHRSAKHEGRR